MINTVSIIGSFRKYYNNVLSLIDLFEKNGLHITSPSKSEITHSIDEFVIFSTDKNYLKPVDIQMITLQKILSAGAIYVCNPDGYIGKTTAYEIGVCMKENKKIFFMERPNDLPIPVSEKQIVEPNVFIEIIKNKFKISPEECIHTDALKSYYEVFSPKNLESNIVPQIVICGSMYFYKDMQKCMQLLNNQGIKAIIPIEEFDEMKNVSTDDFLAFKRKISRSYLKKIRHKNTTAVLIYNAEKNGKENYIGANTLVELAMAFIWNRKIYIFNEMYEPLKDELLAWNCILLNGDLSRLITDFKNQFSTIDNSPIQMSLFEIEEFHNS